MLWKLQGHRDADVEAEAAAHAVEEFADGDFRGGVPAADAAHVPEAALFEEAEFTTEARNEGNEDRKGT